MKFRYILIIALIAIFLAGCSLASDITPPPNYVSPTPLPTLGLLYPSSAPEHSKRRNDLYTKLRSLSRRYRTRQRTSKPAIAGHCSRAGLGGYRSLRFARSMVHHCFTGKPGSLHAAFHWRLERSGSLGCCFLRAHASHQAGSNRARQSVVRCKLSQLRR